MINTYNFIRKIMSELIILLLSPLCKTTRFELINEWTFDEILIRDNLTNNVFKVSIRYYEQEQEKR